MSGMDDNSLKVVHREMFSNQLLENATEEYVRIGSKLVRPLMPKLLGFDAERGAGVLHLHAWFSLGEQMLLKVDYCLN